MTDENTAFDLRLFKAMPGNNVLIKANPPQYTVIAASEGFLKITRTTNGDLVGKAVFDVFPTNPYNPDDRAEAEMRSVFNKVISSKRVVPLPAQRYDLPVDGIKYIEKFWKIVNSPVIDDKGNVLYILIIAEDVTREMTSQKIVQEIIPFKRAHNLYMQAPMAIQIFKGMDLVIEIANDATLDMWARDKSVIGKPFMDVFPELVGQGYEKLMQEVIVTGQSKSFYEAPLVLNRGGKNEVGYFNIKYQAYYEDDLEKPVGLLVFSYEVTEQVISRRRIRETELSLQLALEIGELGVFNIDVKTRKTSYSPKIMEWFNLTKQLLPLPAIISRIHPDDQELVARTMEYTLQKESGGKHNMIFRLLYRKTGELQYLSSIGQVQFDGDTPVTVSGVMQNVTEQVLANKKVEETVAQRTKELAEANNALQQNNRELQQFAYIASHDLQEPLRKVITFAQLLEGDLTERDDLPRNYISKILVSASRMSDLIRDVLEFSRLSFNKYGFTNVNLKGIVDDIITDFEIVIERTNARIEVDSLPQIQAVPVQMQQLFSNLISNSLKFIRIGVEPEIKISSQRYPVSDVGVHKGFLQDVDYFLVKVEDNGIGFSSDHAERIFGIFQRLHGKEEYEGTGIGLALCKKIVHNHFGDIWATSVEGEGSIFYVLLPEYQVKG